jgi:hypothetical protein
MRNHVYARSANGEVCCILQMLCCVMRQFHRIEQRHQLFISGGDTLLGSRNCVDGLPATHVVAKNLDLRLERAPELILLEGVVFSAVIQDILIVIACVSGEIKKSRDESFFQVREAEVFGDRGDGSTEFDGKVDALFVLELLLPVLRCIELTELEL